MAAHSSIIAWKIPWMRRLVGYSPWGHKESDTTKRLHIYIYMCIYIHIYITHYGIWNTPQKFVLKNELLSFSTTWVDLEGIMQSKIRQRKTNIQCYHLDLESKRKKKVENITKQKQTHRNGEQTSGYQWEAGRRER